jgi:predicted PurR-regulated permease PerM
MAERHQIERYAQIAAIAILIVGCLLVVRPFIGALLFAAVVVSVTWPLYRRLLGALGDRPNTASLLMSFLLTLVVVVPVTLLAIALTDNITALVDGARGVLAGGAPPPPAWIERIPVVGYQIADYWWWLITDQQELRAAAERLIEPARTVLVAAGGILGQGILQLLLSILISFFLYRDGSAIIVWVRRGLGRLFGTVAEQIVRTVESTTTSVVFGILGTALAQALVALVGFLIVGVPGALVLAIATFFISMIPAGPPFIWGGVVAWLIYNGDYGWAAFMLVWGMFGISSIDNLVRPILISHGADLPFLLVFVGVLGGLFAFGFIGIFIGPTLLALAYTLFRHWASGHSPLGIEPPVEAPRDPSG